MADMKVSKKLVDFIKNYEQPMLTSYRDSKGVLTIGYGHTGNDVYVGMNIDKKQAEKYLLEDILNTEKAVKTYVNVMLTQNQYDSLVDFTYNVGSNNFKESTLLKKLNDKKYQEASEEFLRWNKITIHGEKIELDGLSVRRYDEQNIFLKGEYKRTLIEDFRKNIKNIQKLNELEKKANELLSITYDSYIEEKSLKNEEQESFSFSYQNQNNQTVQMIN